jgi:hypothetical protein
LDAEKRHENKRLRFQKVSLIRNGMKCGYARTFTVEAEPREKRRG